MHLNAVNIRWGGHFLFSSIIVVKCKARYKGSCVAHNVHNTIIVHYSYC